MPSTGFDLTDEVGSGSGILAAARRLPDGWEQGFDAGFGGCSAPTIEHRCIKTLVPDGLEVAHFNPFFIAASATCAPMSRPDLEARAAERLTRTTEWALGQALATGAGTDDGDGPNPSLADAETIGSFPCDSEAIACLEAAAAETGYGGPFTLLLSIRAAYAMARAGEIRPDQGRWTTPTGSTVVVSSGLPNGTCGDPITAWIVGQLWLGLGDVVVTEASDHRLNAVEAYAERLAVIAFDPCLNLSVTFCGETS